MAIPHLLVVDDDADMQQMMVTFLQRNGFAAHPASTEAEIRAHMQTHRVDLILLDVMLADENGVEICARLRGELELPIILVSALSADHQRMAGYEVGADDYIAKPFNPDLLIARVKAVLRRVRRTPSLSYRRSSGIWHFDGWRYDGQRDEVHAPDGYQVILSTRETALLKTLLANPRIPLSREEIAAALSDQPDADGAGRAIDVLVGRLRSKIERNPKAPTLLRTERGIGYVLACDVTREAE
ncbi:response regulator transcription factor [Thioclava kandeliae]|uniref:Response regulator transcription factor n=1 Tax=Thioclava kandeliae TaxID=3070818 RepID=A0ABV1SDN4_9RHOB